MSSIPEQIMANKSHIIKLITILIIVFLCIFIISKLSTKSSNCTRITTNANKTTYSSLSSNTQLCNVNSKTNTYIQELLLNKVFVKTAHDCCCSGDYKNDYVDNCALKNCRDDGVRALDFQIYSLKNKPIIAASSVSGNKYKEMYNSLDFYTTMKKVKRLFLTTECSNFSDPLFLIFRVNSNIQATYDSMFSSLIEIFGSGSSTGNILYTKPTATDIGLTPISNFISQVVICVYAYDAPTFYKSSLPRITSLDLNTAKNKIRYESELLDLQLTTLPTTSAGLLLSTNTNIAFPNQQTTSANMDFVMTGLYYGITFIGMNFQNADASRIAYDKFFTKGSFIEKDPTGIGVPPLYTINLLDKTALLN